MLFSVIFLDMFLGGCEDRSIVNIYDKTILKAPPSCLALSVIPPHKEIEKRLNSVYQFDPKCIYHMEVSYKNNIHCTSNQNSQRKALSAFPSSFLRIGIRKGMKVIYDYYIDLPKLATPDNAEDAMEIIMRDLKLKK
jgi:hypothetical protein